MTCSPPRFVQPQPIPVYTTTVEHAARFILFLDIVAIAFLLYGVYYRS